MLDFFRDLLTGDSHPDPYLWAAVLLAHALLGLVAYLLAGLPAARLFRDSWAGVLVVSVGYWAWEVLQMFGGAGVMDSLLDWSAFTLGAIVALHLWARRRSGAIGAVCALFAVLAAHTHAIADVTGLQSALDGKAPASQGAKADAAVQPAAMQAYTAPVRIVTQAQYDALSPPDAGTVYVVRP